jgi:creatinine amidohydrolase/Fe(II)-dependent formamide hydrolase-like protein
MHRINHTTEAIAFAIGHGSPIQSGMEEEFFDWHAGVSETSDMLYLEPELVKLERAEKPKITFSPRMKRLLSLSQENAALEGLWSSLFGTPIEAQKKGSSAELSSNGVWSLSDPKKAKREIGEKSVNFMVNNAVKFILDWKKAE